ncbi:MAG: HAMP domain-containing histidine kinase [Spirochaetales bacterium]|nr:HAMP domain-containing histidine kinase [Spirochaetales bacterium]
MAASFIIPLVINVNTLQIYSGLNESIQNNDQGLLIIVSFKLVLMNAIRILPVYMLSFAFLEMMKDFYNRKVPRLIIIAGLLLIPLLYFLIGFFLNIHYDFGLTSIVIILSILFLVTIDLSRISFINKSVSVVLFLIGLQWIDIIPILSDYGFGRGEVSYDIKRTVSFIGAEQSVTFAAVMFCVFFVATAFLILKILRDQNSRIKSIEMNNQIRNELNDLKIQSLHNRTLEEMQNLVHDLRSPLTSIQALISLSAMLVSNEPVLGYIKRISGSVDLLNMMISEILHEKTRHKIDIDTFFTGILSQMSIHPDSKKIGFENRLSNCSFRVNKIRFSRMIINLLNNSISAVRECDGIINILVYKNRKKLIIEVVDNGDGIEASYLTRIKERGFSTKGSSGIGLRFVEDVVNNHEGELFIESTFGIGTKIKMIFNKEKIGYEENTSY